MADCRLSGAKRGRETEVNGTAAKLVDSGAGVVDWSVELDVPADGNLSAKSADADGNVELTPHVLRGWAPQPQSSSGG